MAKNKQPLVQTILNKKARFEFSLFDKYNAGIIFTGSEVKSVREGKVSISEAYCVVINNEVFIRNMDVAVYKNGVRDQEPKRERKLLLRKSEIQKIAKELKDKGVTLVPVALHIDGIIKLEISLAKGKKLYDKRQDLKDRDMKRELARNS